ncbi:MULTISPECIES: TMEM175 family protein [Kordiimonas]|jgi:uncharacterized membrane protein|uniref:TMEM175 family protein n=1 Tax=Kordiimonas TaxID=288021 RepID=UPI00257F9D1F|nr:TMEM175 family protein [Kordiimonas sp. UBA4487]
MRRHMLTSVDEEMSGIRVRGTHVSRLEGLTDAVIGFAITLLIVSMEVPTSLDELFAMVLGFPAFALTFMLLVFIWYWHYRFFRQFGLNTGKVVWANGVLLFLVLLFVYPLKFLATVVVNYVILSGWLGLEMPTMVTFRPDQFVLLYTLYAGGFSAVFLCFVWFYRIALASADDLELTDVERTHVETHANMFLIVAIIPLLTIGAAFLPIQLAPMWAGWANMLIWPATVIYGRMADRKLKALTAKAGGA